TICLTKIKCVKNYLTTFNKLFSPLILALFCTVSMNANEEISIHLTASQQQITGTVIDAETGTPIPGANVIEKGSTNGTTTDFDGNYTITVAPGATLHFSYIGFKEQEVQVGQQTVINVTLSADVTALD